MSDNDFETLEKDDAIALWEKGKGKWNAWVKKNPNYNVDFREADFLRLGKVDFTGFHFPNGTKDFSDAKFGDGDVNFSDVKFGDGSVSFDSTDFGKGNVGFSNVNFE